MSSLRGLRCGLSSVLPLAPPPPILLGTAGTQPRVPGSRPALAERRDKDGGELGSSGHVNHRWPANSHLGRKGGWVSPSHFPMGPLRPKGVSGEVTGQQGQRPGRDSRLRLRRGLCRPCPPSGFSGSGRAAGGRPAQGGGRVLRRPTPQQVPGPACCPASVADGRSAPLGAEAVPGPAPRPGPGCAVGTGGEGQG